MSDEQAIEITETVETSSTDEGDVVTDDVVVAGDEATGDALVDETSPAEAADGPGAAEEIITAIDGEPGEARSWPTWSGSSTRTATPWSRASSGSRATLLARRTRGPA